MKEIPVLVRDLGEIVDTVQVVCWLKQPGEAVADDDDWVDSPTALVCHAGDLPRGRGEGREPGDP